MNLEMKPEDFISEKLATEKQINLLKVLTCNHHVDDIYLEKLKKPHLLSLREASIMIDQILSIRKKAIPKVW